MYYIINKKMLYIYLILIIGEISILRFELVNNFDVF
jgi:hypothetical protein